MAALTSLCPQATPKPSSAVRSTPPVVFAGRRKWAESRRRTGGVVASRLGADASDPLLQAALRAASLRFQESLRPDPLFVDPYSGCLLSPTVSHEDLEDKCLPSLRHYRWTTKYVDDKLLALLGTMDELSQIVLLTDGMDTRPYRLSWPFSCVIFDISPQSVFNVASQKLKGTGAKIGRNCNLVHVPLESIDLQAALYKKGFSGNKPSLWAIQGLPISTLTSLKGILSLVSSSAMKGSILMGELPDFLAGAEFETKEKRHQWTDKLFMSHGFRVNVVGYDEIAKNVDLDEPFDDTRNIVFSAEQLRFSDAEMESWRAHLERIEQEGDEEGFEEL
ncbi:O-methyltransferase 1, chloroplastic-like [Musa acuminata AAA Group]|uniref:O-methyltransferase 1, chloroplastic-like n=1 Tax=Musa acuminata AAA Group TaxID=214697 RepID=UPI0031E2887A